MGDDGCWGLVIDEKIDDWELSKKIMYYGVQSFTCLEGLGGFLPVLEIHSTTRSESRERYDILV